ncbi:HEAT repeat-containing protein 2 [Lobulomyces angularis]|nr:HEAT repeat-containing protein 2 [Lobulomyces angularis]
MMAQVEADQSLNQQETEFLEEITQKLQRDLNILQEKGTDRTSKRKALERVKKESEKVLPKPKVASSLLKSTLIKPLLILFFDKIEKCRDLSISTFFNLANVVPDPENFLAYIIPSLVDRLSGTEILEESEEIRLNLIVGLNDLVNKCQVKISPFIEEISKIVTKTLNDPFPEVKKESCNLVQSMAKQSPQSFAFISASVSKALIPTLIHRHSGVRTVGLKALKDALIVDPAGLDDVLDTLWNLIHDKAPSVRQTLYTCIFEVQMKLMDRWSLAYKILPLLLAGCSDELPNLVDICQNYMIEVGKLYEVEWEDRVKEELQVVPLAGQQLDRPRIGSKHILRENTQKILNKLLELMQDWNVDVRLKSSRILNSFLWYVEECITGYVGTILPILCKICSNDDSAVVIAAIKIGQSLGKYVNPNVYLEQILFFAKNGSGGSTPYRVGSLKVLQSLIEGSSAEFFCSKTSENIRTNVVQLTETLNDKELGGSDNNIILTEVAGCLLATVSKLSEATKTEMEIVDVKSNKNDEEYHIFLLLIRLISIDGDEKYPEWSSICGKASKALELLANSLKLSSVTDVYTLFMNRILDWYALGVSNWSQYNSERKEFESVVKGCGPFIGKNPETLSTVIKIICCLTEPEKEVIVKERHS